MTVITTTDKIKVRKEAEANGHRLGTFQKVDAGEAVVCSLCNGRVLMLNDGRVVKDKAMEGDCSPQPPVLKDSPLVTAVYAA